MPPFPAATAGARLRAGEEPAAAENPCCSRQRGRSSCRTLPCAPAPRLHHPCCLSRRCERRLRAAERARCVRERIFEGEGTCLCAGCPANPHLRPREGGPGHAVGIVAATDSALHTYTRLEGRSPHQRGRDYMQHVRARALPFTCPSCVPSTPGMLACTHICTTHKLTAWNAAWWCAGV